MNSGGLYVFFEGFLLEIVSELDDSFIVEDDNQYRMIPKNSYPVYALRDLSRPE